MDTTVYYKGQANNDNLTIVKRSGQYIISFDIVVIGNGTAQSITTEILINDKVRTSGTSFGDSVNIPLSSTFKLAINDSVKFVVKGSLFPPTLSNCTRSLAYIAPLTTLPGGLSLYTKTDLSVSGRVAVVNGLYGDGGDGFFLDDNATLVNNEAVATIKPAFYRLNAHIKVKNDGIARYKIILLFLSKFSCLMLFLYLI